MLNMKFVDDESAGREPLAVLAELAAKAANGRGSDASDTVPRDADTDEDIVMQTAFQALCDSRGLRAVGSYELTWALYSLGALDSAVGWFRLEGGYFAPYAWPKQRVALMLSYPLASVDDEPVEQVAETTFHDDARDAAFQDEGWLVVRVDPRSRRLDDQLERVAALVTAPSPDSTS